MAAALSLLGEINNALNPQPRTPRGQAWVEAVMGGVRSPHGALRVGRLDRDLWMGWVPQPSQAGGAVTESREPPKTQPTLWFLPAKARAHWRLSHPPPASAARHANDMYVCQSVFHTCGG